MSDIARVVIVGAGQAGAQAAFSLRQGGFAGTITMIGEEPVVPYERPPLSKDLLKGAVAEDALFLKTSQWYADNDVDLRTGCVALSIDRAAATVRVRAADGADGDPGRADVAGGHAAGGEDLGWDALVLATGSRPRKLPLPGADLAGVHEVRTLADIHGLAPEMQPGARMLVVGAGYIGLEVAAVARTLGLEVTVLEAADRVLERVAGLVVSGFFEKLHLDEGVDLRCGVRLAALEGEGGRLVAAVLADGTRLAADVAVVGIGILPNEELAHRSGLACDNGIVVDRDARTSDARIYAIGDCARRPLVHYGRDGRLESVHNAIEQGKIAAASILGKARPNEDVPWFWSDQYDVKLQIAGLSAGAAHIVVRGKPAERKFAAFYLADDGKLLATDAVNSGMEYMASKVLIAAGARPDPDQLADTGVSMKEIVDANR